MKERSRLYTTILAVLSMLTLLFIFIQSLLPPALSGEESGRVAAWLGAIFGESSAVGRFLITYVRKIAHLTEFAVLGVEVLLLIRVLASRLPPVIHVIAPLGGFAVGFVDETLQILSQRGPMIADVWIDAAGFALGYGCLLAVLMLRERIKRSYKRRKLGEKNDKHA